jgi:glycosyltransferase involved in cell wall biosynthesis
LEQTYPNVEIIVIDDGSTDDSRIILNSYGRRIKTLYQVNQGQAVARNNGILESNGELIALLDADDYWDPTKLDQQIKLLNNDCEFVYTGLRQFDSDTGFTIKEVLPQFSGDCSFSFIQFPSRAIVPGGESSAIFTRSLFDRVGNFNPSLSTASGRDFYRRCSRHTKFSFVNELLLNYRSHNSNMSKNSIGSMRDTAEAYSLLFNDPEWSFASKYRRGCLTRLYWSYFKTSIKTHDLHGLTLNARQIIKAISSF